MKALTQADLKGQGCQVPGCDHSDHYDTLFLHGRCHPHAAVTAAYMKATGIIVIRCHKCDALIAELKIAL